MREDCVKIKWTKAGLMLTFKEGADYAAIESEILEKLQRGDRFFTKGTTVEIAPEALSREDRDKLQRIFFDHGILFRLMDPKDSANDASLREKAEDEGKKMLVLNRTLRGGQEIRTEGSVLVCGNVNPGAQIIAGGSIDIRGVCRGMVHAGAFGDHNAFIIADKLMPMQIRIADVVARPPDTSEEPNKAERAYIKEGQIIIESMDR